MNSSPDCQHILTFLYISSAVSGRIGKLKAPDPVSFPGTRGGPVSQPQPRPIPTQRPAFRSSRRRGILRRSLPVLAVLALVAGWVWFRGQLEASLPQLDGERAVAGLSAPVEIERDDLGVPTIRAANRVDAARALGFLHAQDRFFQ